MSLMTENKHGMNISFQIHDYKISSEIEAVSENNTSGSGSCLFPAVLLKQIALSKTKELVKYLFVTYV